MSIVGQAKFAVDTAATAAGKLDAWAKSAQKALADGKELNLFEDAIKGVKLFGQAGMALQCLSMALTAIGMLMGDKSQESQVLSGIKEIVGRIQSLGTDVQAGFATVARQLNVQTGQLELQRHLVNIQNAEKYLSKINALRAAGQDVSTLEDDLAGFNPADFSAAMVQIHDSCVGNGTPTSPNVLTALYDLSYGDITQVWSLGEYLLQKATSALMLHGIVEATKAKQSGKSVDLSQIAALYEDQMKDVAAAVEQVASRCLSSTERGTQIRRYLDDKKVFPLSILSDDKQGSSTRIADTLQTLYGYLNFSVIVYDPVSGFDHHGVAGGNNVLTVFRFTDVVNKQVNILIYWANRTPTNRQAQITYASAATDWHHFPGPRKDRSFDVTTSSHWPDRPPGSRYQFVYDLTGEANKSTNNSMFYGNWGHKNKDLGPILDKFTQESDPAKHEPDSVLWFCFTDGFDDPKQTNIGMTSYNAMYGLVAPYTSICFWAG